MPPSNIFGERKYPYKSIEIIYLYQICENLLDSLREVQFLVAIVTFFVKENLSCRISRQ